ncbi:hypothetical protein GCM10027346_32900 [Hymenobacter seoulensis]
MKTLLKSSLVLALGLLLYGSKAQAQVQVSFNTPYWGPAVGPDVQYYYIPEIDGYYDLYSESYLFYDPVYGAWVSSPVLPRAYASYDPRFFHPVVVQYVGRQPWGYLRDHRAYCGRWGVVPGRYYGANWPGRGYVVAPRPNYEPNGYYNHRPNHPGPYARNDYRDDRDYRGNYHNGYDRRSNYGGGYDQRGNQGAYNGRRDDAQTQQGGYSGQQGDTRYGNSDRTERGGSNAPGASSPQPNSRTGGRGRMGQ